MIKCAYIQIGHMLPTQYATPVQINFFFKHSLWGIKSGMSNHIKEFDMNIITHAFPNLLVFFLGQKMSKCQPLICL